MNKMIRFIIVLIAIVVKFSSFSVKANDDALLKQYDETIFVISNFSGVDANLNETLSIPELLQEDVSGFRFYLEWEKQENQLMIKKADGPSISLRQSLSDIKKFIDEKHDRVLTLFLDFGTNVNEVVDVFNEIGLLPYIYTYDDRDGWPTLKKMIEENHRLVVFSMQEHRISPDWLQYIWNHAVEPYFSIWEAPVFKGEFLKGDPKNSLLIYNDYNYPRKSRNAQTERYATNQNPYLIEHVKNTWTNTGKTPNFIMLDRYENWILGVLSEVKRFRTINGTATYNTQVLNYLNWDKMQSQTSGKFCFPVGPGDNIVLKPISPGFRFQPESVSFNEPDNNVIQNFIATPLNITDNLEGHYTFAKGSRDHSINSFHGKPTNVEFLNDTSRSTVAVFGENSNIVLPGSEKFNIRDHDFSVAAWIKIREFNPSKQDYCIIGAMTNSYQQGLHLLIRNRKPYFGFFNNDLQGKTTLDAGVWYHLVWRYNKLNGEQAIFLNGKLDNRSLGHPTYKGRDNLYIGIAGFNPASYMDGAIDNLSIWSRTLGDEEIFQLNKEVIEIIPIHNVFILYPIISWTLVVALIGIVFFLLYWKYRDRFRKPVSSAEKIRKIEQAVIQKPVSNYIQLFGDFKVLDKEGSDITGLFTPKIKQLFLIILLYSKRNKKGISTQELTDILWKGHSSQSAKNSRGVTIRKLRLILESIDSVQIHFHIDRWSMAFDGPVYCDYLLCLSLLEREKIHDTDFNLNFYHIIQEGELFKGELYDWLDDFKGFIGNNIVDILLKFVGELSFDIDHQLILKLCERVLETDPVNEQALAWKLKVLIKQNNFNLAKFTFERFCLLYEEMYGEKFKGKFEEISVI